MRSVIAALIALLGAPAVLAASPAPALTIVPGNGVTRAADGAGVWDAGMADPVRTPSVTQTFTLRNDTAQPVQIQRLHAACGCTSLLPEGGRMPETLKPGQETRVQVKLRVTGQPAATLHKYAWVYGSSSTPLATLVINLTVRPAAALSPALVNFGMVAEGTARGASVTVTVDKSALAGGSFPALVCTNSAIQVTASGTPQPSTRDGQPSLAQSFQVTLTSHMPVGPITGRLLLRGTANTPPATLNAPGAGGVPLPLFDVSGNISGQITGRLAATPQSVFFGSLPAGQDATRQVVLTAVSPAAAQSLTVAGASPWLTARLLPSTAGPAGMRLLEVTLSGHAPVGTFQSEITVQDAAGEHLSLPVLADLTRAGASP